MTNRELLQMHNEITMMRAKSSVIIWMNQGKVNEFYKQYQTRINTIMDRIKAIQSRYFEMENGKPKMIDVYDGDGDQKTLVKKDPILLIGKTIEGCQKEYDAFLDMQLGEGLQLVKA